MAVRSHSVRAFRPTAPPNGNHQKFIQISHRVFRYVWSSTRRVYIVMRLVFTCYHATRPPNWPPEYRRRVRLVARSP